MDFSKNIDPGKQINGLVNFKNNDEMIYPFLRCSIQDLSEKWESETGFEFTLLTIVSAIISGDLFCADPLIELADIETQDKIKAFLEQNKDYVYACSESNYSKIINIKYWNCLNEFSIYGKNVKSSPTVMTEALNNLFITKDDFKKWAKLAKKRLPKFWYSAHDILNHRINDYIDIDDSDETVKTNLSQVLNEIYSNENKPIILLNWMEYDNWEQEDGLMILAGICPSSKAYMYHDLFRLDGTISFSLYITLNNLVHLQSHADCEDFLFKLVILWKSGNHPERAAPEYFINWAISKQMTPTWHKWATESGYLNHETNKSVGQLSGREEVTYINLIGALCDLYWQAKKKDSTKIKQAEIIEDLIPYSDFYGLSESNLKRKLSAGIKAIRNYEFE